MSEIHTFIIEIPGELELSEEEVADLEGRFLVDAGILIDKKMGIMLPSDTTNINNVRVITRLQQPVEPPQDVTGG